MEFFVLLVNEQNQLTNVTWRPILNTAGVLHLPLQLTWNKCPCFYQTDILWVREQSGQQGIVIPKNIL